jgi:drug/metabolite transporter (DMT)-like permease
VTHVRLGYLLVLLGVVCFSVNAGVSRLVLDSGIDAWTLSELRALGAAALLFALIALTGRVSRLRIPRARWRLLLLYGIVGLGLLQALYFEAIARIPLGLAILIEYLAPLWVALWVRLVVGQQVRPIIWPALAVTLVGLGIVAGSQLQGLDPVGLASAFAAGVCFAVYFLAGERLVADHDPFVVTFWGFTIAAVGWTVAAMLLPQIRPVWDIDYGAPVTLPVALGAAVVPVALLLLWIVSFGTVVPFAAGTAALQWVPATTVSVLAMLEPVGSAAVGWWWFDERLTAFQAFGAVLVLIGITMALFSRAAHPTVAAVE